MIPLANEHFVSRWWALGILIGVPLTIVLIIQFNEWMAERSESKRIKKYWKERGWDQEHDDDA